MHRQSPSKGRTYNSGRDVRRRYTERFDRLLDVMPLCNEIFFYDNENGFVAVQKALKRNGGERE